VKPQGMVELHRDVLNSALHDMLYPLVAGELRSRQPGHCMRISDLDEMLAVALSERLRVDFPEFQIFVLSDSGSRSIPTQLAISSTKLVELRNPLPDGTLRPPLLVFLPPNLRTSAEDSFGVATFEQFRIHDPYQELWTALLADLPQDLRVPVTEIVNALKDSRWPLADALPMCRFLLTIRENDLDAQAVGAALYEFGLVPHFRLLDDSARVPWHIKRNMRGVEKLTNSEKSERGRVVELGLVDATFRAELGAFLEEVGADDPRVWTGRIALDPAAWRFSFDKWQLPDSGQQPDQVCIHSVDIDLPEVQASTGDPRLRELIGQKYLPLGPTGVRGAEVSFSVNPVPNRVNRLAKFLVQLVARDSGPVGNAKVKKAWKTDRADASVKLTGLQKLDLEEGWYFVRVRAVTDQNDFVPLVDRYGKPLAGLEQDRNANESDLFYVVPGATTEEDSVPKSVAEAETLVHAVAKTRIQAVREGRSADSVQITFCDWVHTEGKGRAVKQDEIEVRLGRDGAFRIPVSRVLRNVEERILKEPARLGSYQISIEGGSPGSPSAADELKTDSSAAQEFRAERSKFLSAIGRMDRSETALRPLICQAADWEALSEIVLSYAQSYHRWIKNLLRSAETGQSIDQQQAQAELKIALSLDSVQIVVRNHRGRNRDAVLVGPTHPLRALWFAVWAKLGRAWVDIAAMEPQKYGEGTLRSLLSKLAPVNFPAFIPVDMGRVYATVDAVQPMWSLYAPTREEDPRGLLGEVCSALGLPEPATFGAAITAEDLADRVHRYVLQHPYVRTLNVNVFNGGRATAIAELLLHLQSSPNLSDLKYDIRLFVTDPAAPGVGEAIEALFSPASSLSTPEADQFLTPTGNHLFPKLAFAVRSIEDFRKDPNRFQSHVSMLFDLFPAEEVGTAPPIQRDSAVAVYGLVQEFDSVYSEEDSFVVWKRQPRHGIAQALLGAEELTDELSRLPETVSHATAVVATGQVSTETRPVVSLALRAEERALLHQVHENSDWVFTVDRNLGLEFFDHGRADRPDYLIDYSLDQTSFAGHRFVVSSRSLAELEAMLRPTLSSYNLKANGEHAAILLSQLRSLSGRLALKLISSPTQRAEVLGLALARLYLAYQGALSNQIVVPLDSHLDLYNSLDETGDSVTLQRTDLALFDLDAGNKVVNCRLIEVKCYRSVGGIGSYQQLRSRVNGQVCRSEEVLRHHFDPELNLSDRPDRQLKNRELANLLEFYLDRGVRYKIISPAVEEEARFLLRTLDYGYKLRFTRSALIFDFEKSGTEPAEIDDQIEFHRIGFDLIRELIDGIAPPSSVAGESSASLSEESWTDSTVPKLRSAAFLVPQRDRSVSWDELRRARVLGDDPLPFETTKPRSNHQTEAAPAANYEWSPEFGIAQSSGAEIAPVSKAEQAQPEVQAARLAVDVTIGVNGPSPQFGVLGEFSGRRIGLDLNQTHTISLFGVQGGGKSYTLGSIVELATMAIPGINELPRPLGTVIFHFSTTQAYAPEFVTMAKPNSDTEMVEQLRQRYGCEPKGIDDVVVLAPADKVAERQAEFPGITVLPLAFSSRELQASHWRFLMGAVGSQSLYMKQINHIMRDLRQNLSWERIRDAVANSHLPDNLKGLAETRLNLARLYIDDHSSLSSAIQPGRLVIVDLRDEFLEKDEALGLFVVILQLVADATHQGSKFNKLVVFDEAHKYIESPDLVAGLVEVIREMRHKGTSVLVASQDPLSVPVSVIELSSQIILHRFNAPTWLKHIQRANTALGSLTPDKLNALSAGEAYIWSSKATDPAFTSGPVKVRFRPRVTQHGGATHTAVGSISEGHGN